MDLKYSRLTMKINKPLEMLALAAYILYCSQNVLFSLEPEG